jgi:hypothetical protein
MIGRGLKVALITCTVVALVVSGAGLAAAMPISGAKLAMTSQPASSQWNLNGSNSVDVTYDGSEYVYSVTFKQSGSALSGTLSDPYYPTSGAVSGTVSGNNVTFTFDYPSGSVQGKRTYTGTISQSGAVSGTWTQTGSEVPNNGTWTLTGKAVPGATPSPSPTCEAAQHQTVVTQHAGFPDIAELFTDVITFSWCGGPGGNQPQILSSYQSSKVAESGFGSLSGILLKLSEVAGVTFGVTPATAPTPSVDNGSDSASTTASGLAFYQSINVGHIILLLIPSSLLAKVGLKLLPFLRTGQIALLRTQLQALWSGAVQRLASGLSQGFGLPKWAANVLADFGLGKLVDAAKDRDEKFVEQAILSLAALGSHPALASVVNALQSAIKTATEALTSRTELWGPKITVTVRSGQFTGDYQDSYIDLFLDVSKLHQTTTAAS